ncbi:hypothetical protein M885DRAFT_610310 [Pelagophyceae sp. CCMP2097]|nr:hypothetical protein M885DRAFT_610310 [Pelagophyceae sp. CCMP2097]|mmetsp:Transcript_11828/g.40800  ORF Transcript_11828/g.40800 Transcript_11828/m.40800 type:complete len:200 (-) Transcript_11828:26-625(-)
MSSSGGRFELDHMEPRTRRAVSAPTPQERSPSPERRASATSASAAPPLLRAPTVDLLSQMGEIFHLLDGDGNAKLSVAEVTSLLKILRVKVSSHDVEEMFAEFGLGVFDEIKQADFLAMMDTPREHSKYSRAEIKHAFDVASEMSGEVGPGKMKEDDLIHLLTKCGRNPVSEDEARMLLRQLEPKQGTVNYSRYIDLIA